MQAATMNPPPATTVAAPASTPAFQVKASSLEEILAKVHQRNFNHEQYLNSAFGDFFYGLTNECIKFEKEMLQKRNMFEDKMGGKASRSKRRCRGKWRW
jgi:hypothetical protein